MKRTSKKEGTLACNNTLRQAYWVFVKCFRAIQRVKELQQISMGL